jgi:hypothetical protein
MPKRRDKITIGGPRSPNQVMDQDLWREGRAKIIAAALPLFLRYGYQGVYRRYAESIDAIRRYTLLAYQEAKSLAPKSRSPLFDREQRIAELLKKAAEGAIRAGLFGKDMLSLKVQSLVVLAQAWAVRHWAWAQYPSVKEYLDDLEKIAVAIMSEGAPRKPVP